MTADILEKAEVLAAAIAQSPELKELRSSEETMLADEQAAKIIDDFNKEQQRIYALQAEGKELSEEDNKAIDEMEQKVASHPLIADYLQAQDRFTQMLDSVNSVLANAIAGQDNGSSCSSCGSGCGSSQGGCGGC